MTQVSVVIPLFMKDETIDRCLDSVLNQTFHDFEVIIVYLPSDKDKGDQPRFTDHSHNILVRVIRQKDRGVSSARNQGVLEARSNLVAFLDADDEWLPDHLATLLRLNKKYPEAGILATACLISDGINVRPAK